MIPMCFCFITFPSQMKSRQKKTLLLPSRILWFSNLMLFKSPAKKRSIAPTSVCLKAKVVYLFTSAKAIESIRSIKIGDTEANIRRYYFDYQIYINKLPLAINQMDVSKYFSKFGEVTNVALTTSATDKNPEPSNHCFVKFKSDESVKKCFLMRRH